MKYFREVRQLQFLLFTIASISISAQDTLGLSQINSKLVSPIHQSRHSPQKAALLSTFLPGAGQIYNKKYWKAPIVWGGIGAFAYLWINENNRYQDAKTAYLSYLDKDPSNDIVFNGSSNVSIIQQSKNVYLNQRDSYLLFGILFYGLNSS